MPARWDGNKNCLTRLLCRYAYPENAHLRQVNSAFQDCASLKLTLVRQFLVLASVLFLFQHSLRMVNIA